jgi:hypothetical protein
MVSDRLLADAESLGDLGVAQSFRKQAALGQRRDRVVAWRAAMLSRVDTPPA